VVSPKFLFGFAVVAALIIVFAVAFFAFRDPLLYNNALTVQAVTDKSLYTHEENVSISVYVINGKDESFIQPTTVYYKVSDPTRQEVYSVHLHMNFPSPPPEFPAHSKTLFSSHVWNQKNSNLTLVESGNYIIEVSLEYGTSECEIAISEH